MWWNQTQRMENYNYWGDSRVIESLVTKRESFLKEGSKTTINLDWVEEQFWEWAPDQDVTVVPREDLSDTYNVSEADFNNWLASMNVSGNKEIRCTTKWQPCSQCNGKGKTVNPSIDAGGLPGDYFDDDPEDYERYINGEYDINCTKCCGAKEEQILEYDTENPLYNWCASRLDEQLECDYQSALEYAQEKRMGC